MTNKTSFTTFTCREEKNRWVFDCPACGETHRHTPFEGHRQAHCAFFPNGYEIKLEPQNAQKATKK